MAFLNRLWIIQTTSTAADADTEDNFQLLIRNPVFGYPLAVDMPFPRLNHDARERGRTDEFLFHLGGAEIDLPRLSGREIRIRIRGRDAWLPESIWVIGQDGEGKHRLVVAIPKWPNDRWFSGDPAEGQADWPLG